VPKENPASPEELANRLDLIKSLIVKGMNPREIVRYAREKCEDWKVEDRMVRYYVARAKEELTDEAPGIDRRERFAIAVRRFDLLFNSSFKVHDFKTALSAEVQNVKLMHLDDAKYEQDWREAAEAAGIDTSAGGAFNQLMTLVHAETQEAALESDD